MLLYMAASIFFCVQDVGIAPRVLGGPFFAIFKDILKNDYFRISGISILYHMINMTILELNN